MKRIFTLLALVISCASAFSQGNSKITGTVIDSLTQKPVEFANVALAPESSATPVDGTVCDANGAFEL